MKTFVMVISVLIGILIGIVFWMRWTQSFDPPSPAPGNEVSSPVLALELVKSADEVRSVLRDPLGWINRSVLREQIREDWFFIPTYATCFVLMGVLLGRCRWRGARLLAAATALLAIAAAVFDVLENLGTLRVLATEPSGLTDDLARAISTPSLIKWGLLALVYAALSPLFLTNRSGHRGVRVLSRVAGIALAIAAVLGLVGLAWHPAIAWSSGAMSLGLIAALLIFLGFPDPFLQGQRPS